MTIPPQLWTMTLAALPVTELRAAIPVAIGSLGLSAQSALFYAVLGNLLPVPALYALLPTFVRWAERHSPLAHRLIERFFHHLRERYGERFERASLLPLFLFVAIPVPGAGVWTGTALAILFGIRPAYAVPAIVGGVMAMGVIVLLITTGAFAVV